MQQKAARLSKRPIGQSGRKPKGVRNHATLMAEKLMQDDAEQVVRAVVEKAKQGDMTAARLIIERIAPVRKGRPITLDLPEAKTSADLAGAMASLVRAMATGEVTPDEAATIAGVFEIRRKTIESVDFEERLAALERREQK
ncbi:MAG: hypothetical protein WB715_04350 [Roseiarcus sp.]|uniref:hypothetical protein n=1 Tax=Roseiarcus sp. TaxID=1969460 RepID=UPI003C4F99EE